MESNMNAKSINRSIVIRIITALVLLIILAAAVVDLYNFLSGTGKWIGNFSQKRGLAFLSFVVLSCLFYILALIALWKWDHTSVLLSKAADWLGNHRWLRWTLATLILLIPACMLNFTIAGNLLEGFSLQMLILIGIALGLAYILASNDDALITSSNLALSLLLIRSRGRMSRSP